MVKEMTITEALSGVQTLFLDTAPVIYYVEGHPDYLPIVERFFERIDEGLLTAVTSPITLSECLVLPYRLNAEWLAEHFSALIVNGGNTLFLPINDEIATEAARFRAEYNLSLADALQCATALNASCDAFLTNDLTLKRARELNVLVIEEITD